MIPQVRTLLADRNVTRVVIIDDAYDDRPKSGDIEDERWDTFFDDLTEPDEQRLAAAYGAEAYARQDPSELRRDALFIDTVWAQRQNIASAGPLFAEFERLLRTKREELEPLRQLLETDLQLACSTSGRDDVADVANADIIFLDLYLGFLESEEAVNRAIARVKAVVDLRRQSPPIVVLLSRSPKLMEVGPRLRDEAELLGCQFRMVRKSDLADAEKMAERLYDLVVTYPDSQKVNLFMLAWENALNGAKARFLKSIRTLDLADYANLHSLVLEAEDEPVGDYVLDLYDLHLHHMLEGDEGLVRAAKALNGINWSQYPPAQFMPSAELIDMMDGALFQNETRTRIESEITNDERRVRLGDVFLSPQPQAQAAAPPLTEGGPQPTGATVGEGAGPPAAAPAADADVQPAAPPANGGAPQGQDAAPFTAVDGDAPPALAPPARYAFVVLSQACDLQHANAEQALLLRGTVHPYTAKQHELNRERTPVMRVGEFKYSIEWDVLAPDTWNIDGIPAKTQQGFRRVRRFRTPYALQLQQDFVGKLARVGTMTAVPARVAAGLRVFLRTRNGNVRLLVEKAAESNDAAYLVGRTAKGDPSEKLLLSESLQDEFRRTLRAIDGADLPTGGPTVMTTLRDDPEFYRRFKPGLRLRRASNKGFKPFDKTPHDVVQIVAGHVCTPDAPAPPNFTSIILEVDLD